MPGLFAGGIFAFVTSFDNYAISMWLADAENFPMPMAMFALISRMFDPGIAAIASLMILMSIVIVVRAGTPHRPAARHECSEELHVIFTNTEETTMSKTDR